MKKLQGTVLFSLNVQRIKKVLTAIIFQMLIYWKEENIDFYAVDPYMTFMLIWQF